MPTYETVVPRWPHYDRGTPGRADQHSPYPASATLVLKISTVKIGEHMKTLLSDAELAREMRSRLA